MTFSSRSGAPARDAVEAAPRADRRLVVGLASLHNEDQVRLKDVRPGDTVIVRKAGDVIPEVVGPVLNTRPAGTEPWRFPSRCPSCGSALVRLDGESDTYCINSNCPAQRVQRIVRAPHSEEPWTSRDSVSRGSRSS